MIESENLETTDPEGEPTASSPSEETAADNAVPEAETKPIEESTEDTEVARKTIMEQLQEEEAAKKKGKPKKEKAKREPAAKPKKVKAEKASKVPKAAKPKVEKVKRAPKVKEPKVPSDGKRVRVHKEAMSAAEGKTIGFQREGTKTASVVDWIAERGEKGVTLERVASHYEITEGAAGVRLWRAVLAGRLRKIGEGRGNTRYVVA